MGMIVVNLLIKTARSTTHARQDWRCFKLSYLSRRLHLSIGLELINVIMNLFFILIRPNHIEFDESVRDKLSVK